ncbi:helix-turn-helix transcriptional regulator [Gordonia sp. PKS22-38]|uniref:Helix-turn-helix transcriptional regulator n=1 Tax=Gordonia prachuapensis TaxID=3115651 RepID=A0ABU7MSP1_9ACTN|nr:helix-turn-helix transcriptional regulator [Gordonia sp. PKS22-38]
MKDEIRDFLISRRANVTPEQAGITAGGGERRVPGLRREEVAMLAGVSTDYYTKLERGKIASASDSVLGAIARALALDDIERAHLFDLARPTRSVVAPTAHTSQPLRESLQRMLDSMAVPAIAYDTRQDIVGANVLGRAMFVQMFESDRPNIARFTFLDPRAQTFYDDWELACSLNAAMLRFAVGRDPLSTDLTALIGELSTLSPSFRRHWADQDVHEHRSGRKVFHHPEVGDLEADYDVLEVPGEPGLSITTYTAAAGTATSEKFTLLASWAASQELTDESRPPHTTLG